MKTSTSVILFEHNKCYELAVDSMKYALHQTFTFNQVWISLISELAAYIPHIRWIGYWEYVHYKSPDAIHNINEDYKTENINQKKGNYLHLQAQIGLDRTNLFSSIQDPIIEARAIREERNQIVSQVRFDKDYEPVDPNTRSLISVLIIQKDKIVGVISAESFQPAAFDTRDEIAFIKAGQLALMKIKELENETRT